MDIYNNDNDVWKNIGTITVTINLIKESNNNFINHSIMISPIFLETIELTDILDLAIKKAIESQIVPKTPSQIYFEYDDFNVYVNIHASNEKITFF